jgi:hypothetical protein
MRAAAAVLTILAAVIVSVAVACSDNDCTKDATCAAPSTPDGGGSSSGSIDSGTDSNATPSCGVPNTPCCEGNRCEGGSTCNGSTCVCPEGKAVCANACVDLQSDKAHCGRCGHSCLAGDCAAGVCKAVTVIGSNADFAAVEGGRIYFSISGRPTVTGGMSSVKIDGTDKKTHFTPTVADTGCRGVATTATKVFFICDESAGVRNLHSCDLSGCSSPAPIVRANIGNLTGGIAADRASGKVFFVRGTPYNTAVGGGVFDEANSSVGNLNQAHPNRVVVSDGFVYWLNWGTFANDVPQLSGGVKRASLTSLATEMPLANETADRLTDLGELAVDGSNVYFVGRGTIAEVFTVPVQGGTPTVFATGLKASAVVAADGTNVYFNDENTKTLRYCPRQGCGGASRLLSENESNVSMVTFDAESVIFTSNYDRIRRIAKP